jgi:hypothetical protein
LPRTRRSALLLSRHSKFRLVFSYDRVRAVVKLNDEEIAEYLSYRRAEAVSEIVFPGQRRAVGPR